MSGNGRQVSADDDASMDALINRIRALRGRPPLEFMDGPGPVSMAHPIPSVPIDPAAHHDTPPATPPTAILAVGLLGPEPAQEAPILTPGIMPSIALHEEGQLTDSLAGERSIWCSPLIIHMLNSRGQCQRPQKSSCRRPWTPKATALAACKVDVDLCFQACSPTC